MHTVVASTTPGHSSRPCTCPPHGRGGSGSEAAGWLRLHTWYREEGRASVHVKQTEGGVSAHLLHGICNRTGFLRPSSQWHETLCSAMQPPDTHHHRLCARLARIPAVLTKLFQETEPSLVPRLSRLSLRHRVLFLKAAIFLRDTEVERVIELEIRWVPERDDQRPRTRFQDINNGFKVMKFNPFSVDGNYLHSWLDTSTSLSFRLAGAAVLKTLNKSA